VGTTFEPRLTPPNVGFISSLDEKTKSIILGLADVALNPANSGSDTVPTVLEYFCMGIPVISTNLGIQGLGIKDDKHCLVGDLWRFPELLVFNNQENIINKKTRLKNVRKHIENNFEWSHIAAEFFTQFKPLSLTY
jgi:glycosyltransferase involved in cell wall biosynthesis